MTQRVPAGLRPDAQPVRLVADPDLRDQVPVGGVDRVDHAVVPPGEPQHLAVGGEPAHVGAAPAGNGPPRHQGAGGEVQYGDRALTPVGDVEVLRVATDVQA